MSEKKYGGHKVDYEWSNRKRWLDLAFLVEEYEDRCRRLRQAMTERDLDGLLIYANPGDVGPVRWIANFPSFMGSTIVVLGREGDPVLATDSVMHSEPMHTEVWASWIKDVRWAHHPATVRKAENMTDYVRDAVHELGCDGGRLGLVGERTISHRTMVDLEKRLPDVEFVPASELFVRVKSIRSPREIEHLRRAAQQASRGLDAALELARVGVTEAQLAGAVAGAIFDAGAHELAFAPAVVAGPRAGLKHCYPTDRPLEEGDLVFVDVGATYHGYLSDVCRTFVVGEPNPETRLMQETALRMHEAFIEGTRPGARIGDLQLLAENIAAEAGLADYYYPTGIGHGIANSISELPLLLPGNEATLEAGMTFAVEPMIVKEGVGAAVYEDVVLVTEDGAEVLSDAKKVIAKDLA